MSPSGEHSQRTPPPPLVALVGWLLPGAGYLMLGQRARGLTVGITILSLFLLGLLIAGICVIEVPGYDSSGRPIQVVTPEGQRWVMQTAPMTEVRNKPWAVPQLLSGPVSIVAAALSVLAARSGTGAASHVRVNEIGSLYLSVAGLLNLMAIIDSAHRAAARS